MRIGINCVLRALFFANETEFAMRPAQSKGVIDERASHEDLWDWNVSDGASGTYLLALLT